MFRHFLCLSDSLCLPQVTKIIYEMVQVYGMNEKIGQLAFPKEQGGGWPQDRVYSESTAEVRETRERELLMPLCSPMLKCALLVRQFMFIPVYFIRLFVFLCCVIR